MEILKRKVTVEYIWEGTSSESETEIGVLLSEDRVLVFDGGISVFEGKLTDNSDTFTVNLDLNDTDYRNDYFVGDKNEFLIDIIFA